jgi:hypothetical protein
MKLNGLQRYLGAKEQMPGGIKKLGMFHDVVENTCRKIVRNSPLHDVYENTGTYKSLSTMLMKTKEKAFGRGSGTEL